MDPLPYGKESLVILAGYALGCFTSGYYLVRWRTGQDVRLTGSGSVGATNVARVLGRTGFLLTVFFDFLKGALAVWLADYLQINAVGVMLTMLAVVAGHIWPAQLWFRGGKGVAACLGALVIYNYVIALTFAGLFLIFFVLMRNFVLAGMTAFVMIPLALFGMDFSLNSVFGLSAMAVMILIAHRKNIPDEAGKIIAARKLKNDKRAVPKINRP
jgi:acyl phosphate:glycerol-3-phosphate acyltransferase